MKSQLPREFNADDGVALAQHSTRKFRYTPLSVFECPDVLVLSLSLPEIASFFLG